MDTKTPFIWKAFLILPLLLAFFVVAGILFFSINSDDIKVIALATLFGAELIILVSAGCLLVYLFRKQDRRNLRYFALADLVLLVIAAVVGVRHFF